MLKLFILRISIIMLLAILQPVTKITSKELHFPMKWLLHYLVGTGRTMTVPTKTVTEASMALLRAIEANKYGYTTPGVAGRKYCVYHSTVYDGSGFKNRPTLFYLLGGFTFTVSKISKKSIFVSGTDQYDWHATEDWEGKKNYFCSPISGNKMIKVLFRLLGHIFGSQYFTDSCWPCSQDQAGISNQLWEDLELVGAKPFTSIFNDVEVNGERVEELLSQIKEDKLKNLILKIANNKMSCYFDTVFEDWYNANTSLPMAVRAEQLSLLLASSRVFLPKFKSFEEAYDKAQEALIKLNGGNWMLISPYDEYVL